MTKQPTIITPDMPYFAAAQDCDWDAAERIAIAIGPEHVARVQRAAALAEAEAILADMDDGWETCGPDNDEHIQSLGYDIPECRTYEMGTYDCDDAEQRSRARAELRAIIRELAA